MDYIIKALHKLGEEFEVNGTEVKVHLSWLVGDIDIKFDYVKNQWVYRYQQVRDVLLVFLFLMMAGLTDSEHSFAIPAFWAALALTKLTTCVLKEVRVAAIKQQIIATEQAAA